MSFSVNINGKELHIQCNDCSSLPSNSFDEKEQNMLNQMDNLTICPVSQRIRADNERIIYDVNEAFCDVFSQPPVDDGILDKITAASDIEGEYRDLWPGIVQQFSPSAHRITAFVKKIDGFSELNDTDQIVLLRGCVMDILFFRMGSKYDAKSHSLPLRNGNRVLRKQASSLCSGALWPFLEPLFKTAEAVAMLSMSVTESALAIAILALATDRVGLTDPPSVNLLQLKLKEAAQHHVERTNPENGRWSRILTQLTAIRGVSKKSSYWIANQRSFRSVLQLSIQILEDAY